MTLAFADGEPLVPAAQVYDRHHITTPSLRFFETGIDCIEQILILEWLCQKFDSANLHGADRHRDISMRHDDRDRISARNVKNSCWASKTFLPDILTSNTMQIGVSGIR